MALVPAARATHRLVSPAVLLGTALGFLGLGYALGRDVRATVVRVAECPRECPVSVVTVAPALAPTPAPAPAPAPAPTIALRGAPSISWAATVRGFSTQYSATSWSATQVLGAPDVYPQHGDLVKAWASRTADGRDEWIEVGFARAQPVSLVEVYETFNPGAIAKLELVTQSGRRIEAPPGHSEPAFANESTGGAVAHRHVTDVGCTTEPIVAVRVHLASTQVPGWNELDAIGIAPCLEAP